MLKFFSDAIKDEKTGPPPIDTHSSVPPFVTVHIQARTSINALRADLNSLMDWGPYEAIQIIALRPSSQQETTTYRVTFEVQISGIQYNIKEFRYWESMLRAILEKNSFVKVAHEHITYDFG